METRWFQVSGDIDNLNENIFTVLKNAEIFLGKSTKIKSRSIFLNKETEFIDATVQVCIK